MRELGPYSHGIGCNCETCISVAKCGGYGFPMGHGASADSPHQEKIAGATAKSLFHEAEAGKHNDAIWAHGREGSQAKVLDPEKVAKHITAATMHNRAGTHYRDAAQAYSEGRPAGAKEHEKFADQFAEKAKSASEAAFKG